MEMQHQAMEINELIQTVTAYTGSSEAEPMLTTAFQIAVDAHAGFQRLSGDPYLNHALAVASILAEWHAPPSVVTVGLLHDILNPDYSRKCSLDGIQSLLGPDIFRLLEATANLNNFIRRIERDFDSGADASDFRYHMPSFLQQERDAVVIKIADRLHNLQTISALTQRSQQRSSRIGLNLFAPLADRLGMGAAKRQLEDYCFEINNPTYYKMLKQHYLDSSIHQEIKDILKELQQNFGQLRAVRWQSASLYTIYRHQIEQNIRPGKLIDAQPLRIRDAGSFIILTEEENDCYQILGTLHKLYHPMKEQFRDFIADSKENGYRSLHTQVKHSSGHLLHIIIRTHTMHLIAESGITARWRNVPEECLPHIAEEIKPISDEIQVFTPDGEIKYFPQEATVLDFAYEIHTDVGRQCVGALLNGERTDLYRVLRTGDRIEIIAGGPDAAPSLEWLSYVRTPRALSEIRHWLTQHRRNEMAERGRLLLDRELQRLGMDSSASQVRQLLSLFALKENLEGMEDLLISIGVDRHKAPKLVASLKTMGLKLVSSPNSVEPMFRVTVLSPGEALLPRVLARCCRPVPPDDIVGFLRSDQTLTIHHRGCSEIKDLEKLIQVKWDATTTEPHYVVVVEAMSQPDLVRDLSTVMALLGHNMLAFSSHTRPDGVMAETRIDLGKTTFAQRNRMKKELEAVPHVTNVEFIHSSFLSTPTQEPKSPMLVHHSNPYGPSIAAGPRFYGREAECDRISALLRDQSQNTAILLWGQKRIGKTSLLIRLQEQARGDFLPVYIDIQGLKDSSTTQFLYQLMSRISVVLKEKIRNSEITVPALNRLRKDPLTYFDTFMGLVQEVARQYPLVVILDEFQCLCSLREEIVSRSAIFSRLRSHSLHGQGIHFILSGGGLLNQLTRQCDIASLFNITRDEKLSCLDLKAARQLIKDGLARIGNIGEPTIEFLLTVTAGHPFYLQLLCSRLYDQAQEHKTMVTSHFAYLSIHEWVDKADDSRFQHLWEGHDGTSAQRNKLIVSAIAQLGDNNREVDYAHLARATYSTVSEQDLVQSLVDLTDLGVLKHTSSNYYAIQVELFARWLRHHWPLELTLKEAHSL